MKRSLVALVLVSSSWTFVAGAADDFPKPYDSEPAKYGQPWPAAKAAAAFRVPEGFEVSVFAAEPDVRNPIAASWDGRGRLWVAENYTYAERPKKFELALRDRIVVLADTDGDGRSDRRTVFADDLQMLTGVEWSPQGVWAICPPQLLFIPDADGDDRPDGPPRVVLDGVDVSPENSHNFANGLRFGPDGWLYGRCGASCPGRVGEPGTPAEKRVPLVGGMWRFDPHSKTFENLCHGTTNPWGHDWNEHGEGFFINTVNGHLWHLIAGAHYVRPHTIDPNPRVYECIDMHADHWHFDTGKGWIDSRSASGEHDRLGGGHAHCGTMIYLADNWPKEYRGRLLTLNMHGRRANDERLEREGSGYVARHEPDLLFAADPFFRGMEMLYGPDGTVHMLDWSDSGECHDSDGVHRSSGRVYRITHGHPPAHKAVDLAKLTPEQLVALHRESNEWFSRQARLRLQALADAKTDLTAARAALVELVRRGESNVVRLRALWTLHAAGGVDPTLLAGLLTDGDEHVRTWAVRLIGDAWPLDSALGPGPSMITSVDSQTLQRLTTLAQGERSGLVRLALASTLQRLPVADRAKLAAGLVIHAEDADDHNLPPLVWYGLIPVADQQPAAMGPLFEQATWPRLRQWISRRACEDLAKQPTALDDLLRRALADASGERLTDALAGMTAGLAGWHKAPQPGPWTEVGSRVEKQPEAVREQWRELSVLFGDGRALDEVRKIALDDKADLRARRAALETLIQNRSPDLRAVCEKLMGVRFLNSVAARGLATFNDPAIGLKVAKGYRSIHKGERAAVMEVLVSRPSFAAAMLEEMAAEKIPRADLSVFQVRQIRSFGDAKLTRRLTEVWGELHDTSADKQQLMTDLRKRLTPSVIAAADTSQGRLVFDKVCSSCHRLYGRGGAIGPDLTGAGRQNLDYLLGNIVDPSAVVTADFRMSVIALEDGRVLNGIVRSKTDRTLVLQTAKEQLTLDRGDIETVEASTASLMPEGVLQPLSADQVRDLFAYLMTHSQVPLPADAAAVSAAP